MVELKADTPTTKRKPRTAKGTKRNSQTAADDLDEVDDPNATWEWKRSSRNTDGKHQHVIAGARHGSFEIKVGDCVRLKAEGSHAAWVGLVIELGDHQRDSTEARQKSAKTLWFSSPDEVFNNKKKRTDVLPHEIYITPSSDWNPLESILGKATILSPSTFESLYPSGTIAKGTKGFGKTYSCRFGCNTRTANYTDEFIWERQYQGEEDLGALQAFVEAGTKPKGRRRKAQPTEDEDGSFTPARETAPKTPTKKRKTGLLDGVTTPGSRSQTPTSKLATPSSRRGHNIKKALEITPLATRTIDPAYTSSPFQLARNRLHISSVPTSLPCREDAFKQVYSRLEAAISDGTGSCIYISGTPGTGKTATVREAVAHLDRAVRDELLDDFIFVEISGMKVTEPHQAYSLLWEALRGQRVSPMHALDLLETEFTHPNPRRVPCVVLMDELDQLVTKNQGVMYNFFNWPALAHSRLIVLAVANTMDLPERTLSNKISSRLGLTRITFPGYTYDQLMRIIEARLEGVPSAVVDRDAIQFASRKVAAVSGDARRALDICRRAVEIAEAEFLEAEADPELALLNTPSKKHKSAGKKTAPVGKVTTAIIKKAIAEATSSPLQQGLRSLPLAAKLVLVALLGRSRRSGISDSNLGEVLDEARRAAQMTTNVAITDLLLSRKAHVIKNELYSPRFTRTPAPRVLGVNDAALELVDAGVIALESRRTDRSSRVKLMVNESEVRAALSHDVEVSGLGIAS